MLRDEPALRRVIVSSIAGKISSSEIVGDACP